VKITLRPLAQRDLDEIWDYSADRWGVDQANRYLSEIRDAIGALAKTASLSSDAEYLHPGLRKTRSGAHLIYFFFFANEGIDVVRILHERRDVSNLL
jgi:toxin ParE1/3/4